MKIGRGSVHGANAQESNEENKHRRRRPVLKTSAQSNAPVIQRREKNGQQDAE